MTYWALKKVISGLLVGDNILPDDEEVVRGLVDYALNTVATTANSLHLLTLDPTGNILRISHGDYYIRVPDVPSFDDDKLDIDKELAFAVARYVASYISKDKGGVHAGIANRIILDFNANVAALLENISIETITSTCDSGSTV